MFDHTVEQWAPQQDGSCFSQNRLMWDRGRGRGRIVIIRAPVIQKLVHVEKLQKLPELRTSLPFGEGEQQSASALPRVVQSCPGTLQCSPGPIRDPKPSSLLFVSHHRSDQLTTVRVGNLLEMADISVLWWASVNN